MKTSLIVLTYNWPESLKLVLRSVAEQSRLPDEVIVADDGSASSTRDAIMEIAQGFPRRIVHLWQDDTGFRAARARNRGIAAADGEVVILIDGDMLPHRQFIADHLALARPGCFLQGGRLLATERETARLLAGGVPRFDWRLDGVFDARREFKRRHALHARWLARIAARRRGNVMSCNMSFWRGDLVRVNGFDERMQGYGSEDLELAARLRNAGVRQRQIKYAGLAIHLHHATRSPGDPDDPTMPNYQILRATREQRLIRCERGLDQHSAEFVRSPPDLRKH